MSLSAAGAEAGKLGGDAFHLGQKFPGGVLPGARVIDKKQGGIPAVRVHRRGGAAVAEGYRGRISPGDAELIGPALHVIKGLGGSVVMGLWREAPDKDRQKDRRQNREKDEHRLCGQAFAAPGLFADNNAFCAAGAEGCLVRKNRAAVGTGFHSRIASIRWITLR